MIKSLIPLVFLCVVPTFSYAAINLTVAPQGWQFNTDTTEQIKDYLSKNASEKSSLLSNYSPGMIADLNKFSDKVRTVLLKEDKKKTDTQNSDVVCKISISIGKTAPSDPEPPEVVMLDNQAENNSAACQSVYSVLKSAVSKKDDLKYPYVVKDSGILSINLIYSDLK